MLIIYLDPLYGAVLVFVITFSDYTLKWLQNILQAHIKNNQV